MGKQLKYIYKFGDGSAEGSAKMKKLLGGKGANLAEMNLIGLPVPPGFTITTEVCNYFTRKGKDKTVNKIDSQVQDGIQHCENVMNTVFGSEENPLLMSVRSGARVSMPGMMDTVLNLGLNDKIVKGLISRGANERFVWDSYRRLIQMYGDVVMGMEADSKVDADPFENEIKKLKTEKKAKSDADLKAADLKELVSRFKLLIKEKLHVDFPEDPWEQFWGAILAVFESWNNDRAKVYRSLNRIPEHWGTAVNCQAMVFGNLNDNSATGVAFTRDAASGENIFSGEFLINAQGEDVVAGVRTPQEITLIGSQRWAKLTHVAKNVRAVQFPSLEELMPEAYHELFEYEQVLEHHYKDMQDLEFTIQDGKLWILQTRSGKRTGKAMIKIALDILDEGLIDERTALMRVDPERLNDLLHPVFEKGKLKDTSVLVQGLPASPGAACGQIVFFADDAEEWAASGKDTILVRQETSPEDLRGMHAAKGILTARGGMTSHAAVVARGMGKCCVSGAGRLHLDYKKRELSVDDYVMKEGDWISLNGNTGEVYPEEIATIKPKLESDFGRLMKLANRHARMQVRTNADSPEDAMVAKQFGAKGIGLCRTEHMFFEGERIIAVREMILSGDEAGRRSALRKLLPMQRTDFEGVFRVMKKRPVTIRLLDPPLHEFLPHVLENQQQMAIDMNLSLDVIKQLIDDLDEVNPMLGHRGCRLGIAYPEITEIQTRAIIEAALNVKEEGIICNPEIMIPLIGTSQEYKLQDALIRKTAQKVFDERSDTVDFKVGTMIEIPRATLIADQIAEEAEFFSFGTNDLTQMTFGYSRDDIGKFLPTYLEQGILSHDPFKQIDEEGVGQLVRLAVKKGRGRKSNLKVGICGEHGGNPESIHFFESIGLNYVSCSPYRVPIARLAAAQANIQQQLIDY